MTKREGAWREDLSKNLFENAWGQDYRYQCSGLEFESGIFYNAH